MARSMVQDERSTKFGNIYSVIAFFIVSMGKIEKGEYDGKEAVAYQKQEGEKYEHGNYSSNLLGTHGLIILYSR